ncbi:hypothetical protein D5085_14930 [Ectothiorhodospiraceae bacterium BW-2]|nr:hypothetical protein D5085_14930 [Ectothiorhodospiraceae bacterium BW-2]
MSTNTANPCLDANTRENNLKLICLQLAALGHPCHLGDDVEFLDIIDNLLKNYGQHRRLLASSGYRCPADQRIQNFLSSYLDEHGIPLQIELPGDTFTLIKAGLARELSLPTDQNHYKSPLLESYRIRQGVLHNPKSDRRTTQGVFHIVEGPLPVPADKKAVPVKAYSELLTRALQPPDELMLLPLSSGTDAPAHLWVSMLLRPVVRPEVEGILPQKSLEIRFFAPGSLVSNLDFVESIFGNGGDPFLPENDAALDIDHWTGHTGCIILAPHLTGLTKEQLGLPHYDEATERQRRDGMCWQKPGELYNDGNAFKIVCRDSRGVVVTLIADNYYGYSKKEIKSQISYSANLFGGSEEEHAGGALAFPRFNLGEIYMPDLRDDLSSEHTFTTLCEQLEDNITVEPEGYARDRHYSDILYLPENARIDMAKMEINWYQKGLKQRLKLRANETYIYPTGFRVELHKHPHAPSWRLIGTLGEGTFCHKPSTVSGGGKSEISKSIQDSMLSGPIIVGDIHADFARIDEILNHDYRHRFLDPSFEDERSLLDTSRSLGSVIKLLTPSETIYSAEYNAWLREIPQRILAIIFIIKRFYKAEWKGDWRKHFTVDEINGMPGHELKFNGRTLATSYLRLGTHSDGTWRIYKLRQDFVAAEKVQMEDDISVSTVIPQSYLSGQLNLDSDRHSSIKLIHNCETRLFQRPDDAIHRGFDKQTEHDLAENNNFISNFEPLTPTDAKKLIDDVVSFDDYTPPMQQLIRQAADDSEGCYFVSSAHPRIVNGKPSPNMRYLQYRPDLAKPRSLYLAKIGTRLSRSLTPEQPVLFPVDAVLQGRRNNPIDRKRGIRPLAVYNPIHYQELPELFAELICSLTGKSPSTTGAGSEGALTKGPFNNLSATADLNNALVAYILCGHAGFTTAAGYIGHRRRIDHDISMLIPEIWCRIPPSEREPDYLIDNGYLEKLNDFEHEGQTILASRLGYRITSDFVFKYFGKIFDSPMLTVDESLLQPESQDREAYIDGINNIVEAQQRVAQAYFEDGTIEDACPPLKALLHIMAYGNYQGMTIESPPFRQLFSREALLASDWYQRRLQLKQQRDIALWQLNHHYLEQKFAEQPLSDLESRDYLLQQLQRSQQMIDTVASEAYLQRLHGTLGADPIHQ